MDLFLTDQEIQNLINEKKSVPLTFDECFSKQKTKRGHREFDHTIPRDDGSSFSLKLRQSRDNQLDFSAILGYTPKEVNRIFLLKRYNGKSHRHRNVLDENKRFYDFHIHTATERYQLAGRKEEFYAEKTDRYSDLRGAFRCLIEDCNVSLKKNPQTQLPI